MTRVGKRTLGAIGGLAILALGVAAGSAAYAAGDMAKAIEYRRNLMKAIGGHAADIGLIVKGEVPYGAPHILAHAEAINAMSKLIVEATPKGSGPEAGDTNAKDDIWQKWDDFKAAAARLDTESAKLVQVAKGGDMKAIGAQVAAMGKNACGGCHTEFRKPLK